MMNLQKALLAFFIIGALCLAGVCDRGGSVVYAQPGPSFGGLEGETGPPVTGKVVEDGKTKGVAIASHSGQWTSFFSMEGGVAGIPGKRESPEHLSKGAYLRQIPVRASRRGWDYGISGLRLQP